MSRRTVAWAALAIVCALSVAVVYRLGKRPSLEELFAEQVEYIPVPPCELPEPVCTDKFRPVQLFRVSQNRESISQETRDARELVEQQLNLVRTAPPDEPCNCYGWVFANGKYWLAWQDAETILKDNGYLPVVKPKVGDLVAYRNRYGVLIHIGMVHTSTAGDEVQVESQWGRMGRYLHAVQNQTFSEAFSYLRSARRGHVLLGLDRESPPLEEIEE